MKLSDHLLYRDIKELGQIASLYQCDCNRNSKLELVQAIHHHMFNPRIYKDFFQHLQPSLIYFLTYLLFQKGQAFTIDELMAKGKFIGSLFALDESPRKWITQLLKKGWLFPSPSKFQMQLEFPNDFHSVLKKQVLSYWTNTCKLISYPQMEQPIRDEGNAILVDIQTFLKYITENRVSLTLDGVIHKRHQHRLLQQFQVNEQIIVHKDWRFGYGRRFPSYPNRFALIYDFCFYKDWIREEQTNVYISGEGLQQLNSQHMEDDGLRQALFHFWISTYKHPIPSLPFLITFMYELCSGQWLESKQLYKLVQGWLKPFYYDDVQTLFQQRIIQTLIHLGMIQVSSDKGDSVYLRFHSALAKAL